MTAQEIESIGLIIDRAENLLAATQLQLPLQMHIEGLKGGLRNIIKDLQKLSTQPNP